MFFFYVPVAGGISSSLKYRIDMYELGYEALNKCLVIF